jgi:hypothetical protein
MPVNIEQKTNWFLWLIGLSCLAVIASSFYSLYFKKNYEFVVETSCNPEVDICFERDCTNPDDCPPNQLEDFKRYNLNAADFAKCENEDCTVACETGLIKCDQITCTPDELLGESCTTVEPPITTE